MAGQRDGLQRLWRRGGRRRLLSAEAESDLNLAGGFRQSVKGGLIADLLQQLEFVAVGVAVDLQYLRQRATVQRLLGIGDALADGSNKLADRRCHDVADQFLDGGHGAVLQV